MNTPIELSPTAAHMIEHTLVIYGEDFVLMPTFALYDEEMLKTYESLIAHCHIYFIGKTPRIQILGFKNENKFLIVEVDIGKGKKLGNVKIPIPQDHILIIENDRPYVKNSSGKKFSFPSEKFILEISNQLTPLDFEVLYIEQSYGKEGERNAINRLMEHKTLQEIAVREEKEDYDIHLILIGINKDNYLVTHFDPHAKDKDSVSNDSRITKGIDKLYGTSNAERNTLYEAALIRYFQPSYNKRLKNSFPSTNMKMLKDCYNKDFQAIVAEFNFDYFPYRLYSQLIPPRDYHIAHFYLHQKKDRRSFFNI